MNRDRGFCQNCIHRSPSDHSDELVQCRRFPPTLVPVADAYPLQLFPEMKLGDWCGEWRHDPETGRYGDGL